jgi:hypothetical protein
LIDPVCDGEWDGEEDQKEEEKQLWPTRDTERNERNNHEDKNVGCGEKLATGVSGRDTSERT